jgi:molybdate transport system ATP-binding protein
MQNLLYVKKDKELAKYLLEMTEMYELKDRHPHSLSGGQKQRVSLCRGFNEQTKTFTYG